MKTFAALSAAFLLASCAVQDAADPAASPSPGPGLPSPSAPAPSAEPYPFTGRIYGTDILAAEGTYADADFDALKDEFVFFGHQSVGNNILAGLDAISASDDRYLINHSYVSDWYQLSHWTPSYGHGSGGLGDHDVGENYDPASKIASFTGYMTAEDDDGETIGGNARIAFFKFCFVDIDEGTDAGELLSDYIEAMQSLESRFPSTIFVYATAPLLTSEGEDNVRHDEYNALLRAYCDGNDRPLFDIADLEAANADGTRATFMHDGTAYDKLSSDWSNGTDPHLNENGGRRIARAMILMLVDLIKNNPVAP